MSTIDDAIISYLKTGAGQPRLVRFLPARVLPRDGFIGIVTFYGIDQPPAPKMFYRLPDGRVTTLLVVGGGAIYYPEHPLAEHDICVNCYNMPGAAIRMLFDWPFKIPVNAGCDLNPILPLVQAGVIRLLADVEYLVGDTAFYTVQVTKQDYYYMYCHGIPIFEEAIVRSISMFNRVDLSDSISTAMSIGDLAGKHPVYLDTDEVDILLRIAEKLGIDVTAEWECGRCMVISMRGRGHELCVERRSDYYVFTAKHCIGEYIGGEPLKTAEDIDGYIAWNQI